MNEMAEFLKDENSFERILPIVITDYDQEGELKKGADIYTTQGLTNCIAYWEDEEKKIRKQLKKFDISNLSSSVKELSQIIQIQKLIGDFIYLIRRIKHVNQEELMNSLYKDLLERIGFGEQTLDDCCRHRLYPTIPFR